MLSFSPIRCNSGRKPTGAKLALKPVHVWGIRIRLQVACKARDLALFDLALDSKLRGCDLVSLKVGDLLSAGGVKRRVVILQRKTGRPVQFEVTEQARRSIAQWIEAKGLGRRRLAVSKPDEAWSPPQHATVREAGRQVGCARWPGSGRLWHPQHAPDEGLAALQEDRQPQSLSAPAGAYEARKYGPLPWRRSGRCLGAFRGS